MHEYLIFLNFEHRNMVLERDENHAFAKKRKDAILFLQFCKPHDFDMMFLFLYCRFVLIIYEFIVNY